MTYDLTTRLDRLGARMSEINDNTLTYVRGNVSIEITNYTPVKIKVEQLGALGIVLVTHKYQRFAFDASKLSIFEPAVPEIGDKLTIEDGTAFEVISLDNEVFSYTTSSRVRFLVNTIQVS